MKNFAFMWHLLLVLSFPLAADTDICDRSHLLRTVAEEEEPPVEVTLQGTEKLEHSGEEERYTYTIHRVVTADVSNEEYQRCKTSSTPREP